MGGPIGNDHGWMKFNIIMKGRRIRCQGFNILAWQNRGVIARRVYFPTKQSPETWRML
jgi:hypothetical protein